MLLQRRKRNRAAAGRVEPATGRKLYSIHGLLNGRAFDGRFDHGGATYLWSYQPQKASVSDRKLELTGRFSVRPGGSRAGRAVRSVEGVRATLAATQGGLGAPPTRRQLVAATAQNANVASPSQQQEQAKAPETTQQPTEPARPASRLPITEFTDDGAFIGVMYFHLQPLDNRSLGVPALDLGSVQINARLAPVDDTARDLQFLFSDLVAAVYGARAEERAASDLIAEINRVLRG